MEDNSINRGMDLLSFQSDNFDLTILPLSALANNNHIVLSLLSDKDVQSEIPYTHLDGVTEKTPFFSLLIWVALIYLSDWQKEKKILQKMLESQLDCNYCGMCGFNLFHFYLSMAMLDLDDGFTKLKWWVDKPMVDCNIPLLSLQDRPNIVFIHPSQFVSTFEYSQQKEKVILYLLSRGMSYHLLGQQWLHLIKTSPSQNKYLKQRLKKQQPVLKNKKKTSYYSLPTPQMNDLEKIPVDQHLRFTSSNGVTFHFHASFMDSIVKTHTFPFTLEKISPLILREWLCLFEKKWMPREEFIGEGYFLCHDVNIDGDKLFIHYLDKWIRPVYPYSRIILFSTFALSEKMFQYMCWKLRSNIFHLKAFHQRCHTTWKNFFLWACYASINEFFFANQIEELVSQLEIFYSWKSCFLQQYPDLETFLFLNCDDETSIYKIYCEQYDYSMSQVYNIFKKMCLFVKNKE